VAELLGVRNLRAGYGETVVLEDIELSLPERGTLALLGRNGVGKTTLLATLMGHTTLHAGEIAFAGRSIQDLPVHRRARLGMGNQISGGEQQMLAIGRALMGNPSLLLMDEPFEGLAPIIVEGLLMSLRKLIAENSLAIVLVEQSARLALEATEAAIVLDRGRVAYSGRSRHLLDDPGRLAALFVAR